MSVLTTLITGHGQDREAFDAARRLAARTRLIVLTTAPESDEIARCRENEALSGVAVEVVTVDRMDLLGAVAATRDAIRAHRASGVRVHVAGGPNLLASGMLLAAFEEGVEAFFCHARGRSRLPVAVTMRFSDLVAEGDRGVLLALRAGVETDVETLGDRATLSPGALKGALLRLRAAGLVRANARVASLTETGAYYRDQFLPRA